MALLSTGFIKNLKASGERTSSTLAVKITNRDSVSTMIRINGFYLTSTETKTEYVLDVLTIPPEGEVTNNYFAEFDAFQFQFLCNSDEVEISVWGKNPSGNLAEVYQVHSEQLFPMEAKEHIYVPNSNSNKVSIIDGGTNTLQGDVAVGLGPFGISVNSLTNRIYVANFWSNNVSVIDGESQTVIAKVAVNSNPLGVGVNPVTNRIYVTNRGSNNVSVIDGLANVVIDNILVGASPEGITVNPTTNRIYVTNQGNKVSVINGNTNTVIATVEVGG
ncbi:YncE family protein [Desulfosporosinus sp. SYSU MS00001]|uniref:YncE family protein n=1 Tax=Desulfosporosinus sp. SYSU MS00001 TaxID=3416284 RepID=UPI003CF7BABB